MTRLALVLSLLHATGCGDPPQPQQPWQIVYEGLPSALLSVWGTSATDVWMVGADARDGTGPLVLHYDGEWERVSTGLDAGGFWWVFGFEGGPIYMGGEGGVIVRYQDGVFTPMTTPGTGTVFGIWGASPDDVWAVGAASDASAGFVWRLEGDAWVPEPTLPEEVPSRAAIWKVYGTARNDVWLVGSNGVSMHWDGSALSLEETGVGSSLFTVHANDRRFTAVGGLANGIIMENEDGVWRDVTPGATSAGLSGVCLAQGDFGVAVGGYGTVYLRGEDGWREEDTGHALAENFHAAWLDPEGGIWAVGGQTFSPPLTSGLLMHRGDPLPEGEL